ncbi:hypothetical protein HELRODRAFT_163958 [Helobdella robusta]|uniref:Uncharacterized protein n=1 Tax=Helobdella robusta TaxID=6412 RepID=T1EUN8_HELRO|nr:hypothetical protein HELRODRAFT_163958 [Helobdella robusta]ESN94172.1 hypothetical protein HELRODRAFT_163958 [Helobdella robusta]
MDVEEDLLIVDEVGVSSQQAGREQTSARPVFSDPERVYCRVADPGQERLRRSEGSGGYSYADAVRDRVVRNSNVARRKSTNIMKKNVITTSDATSQITGYITQQQHIKRHLPDDGIKVDYIFIHVRNKSI